MSVEYFRYYRESIINLVGLWLCPSDQDSRHLNHAESFQRGKHQSINVDACQFLVGSTPPGVYYKIGQGQDRIKVVICIIYLF